MCVITKLRGRVQGKKKIVFKNVDNHSMQLLKFYMPLYRNVIPKVTQKPSQAVFILSWSLIHLSLGM